MNNYEKKGLILRIIWGMTAFFAVILLVVYFIRLDTVSSIILAKKAEIEAAGGKFILADADAGIYSRIGGDDTLGSDRLPGKNPDKGTDNQGQSDKPVVTNAPENADTESNTGSNVKDPVWSSDDGNGSSENTTEGGITEDGGNNADDTSETAGDGGLDEGGIGTVKQVLDPSKPIIAFSFDDGPSEKATTRILDVLEKYGCHATFFTVGYEIDNKPDLIRREYEMGMEVANHTVNHKYLAKLDENGIKSEVWGNAEKLKAIVPISDPILRPPYGNYNDLVKATVGVPIVCWSVDSRDWETRHGPSIVEQVKQDARDGYIVLMHDIYTTTADAVEVLVPWLIEQGYQITSVSEMFAARGEEMLPGHVYRMTDPAD